MAEFGTRGVAPLLMALHLWRVLSGIVTIVLIANFFSAELQGLYYGFAGIIAAQGLFELGMNIALMNASAREWALLSRAATGSETASVRASDRLLGIARAAMKWYAGAALLFVALVAPAGLQLLDRPMIGADEWRTPWLVLVLASGMQVALLPVPILLEGCGRLAAVTRARVLAVVTASIASMATIALGGGLWAMVVASSIAGPLLAALLVRRNWAFFAPMLRGEARKDAAWIGDIWPMQWRLAAQNFAAYAATHFLTVLLYQLHGPVVAGRFGMSWQIASTVNQLGMAPAQARAPLYAAHAARRQFDMLDDAWRAAFTRSVTIAVTVALGVVAAVATLGVYGSDLAGRLLPVSGTGLLLAGSVWAVVVQCEALYLRAFGKEPYLAVSLVASVACAALALLWGLQYEALGVAFAYFTAATLSLIWASLLFASLRVAWRKE